MLMSSISKSTLKIKATQNVHCSKGKEISFSQRLDVIFFFQASLISQYLLEY